MRTTVTLDDDLAVWLERRQAEEGKTFKDVLNEAVRLGRASIEAPPQRVSEVEIEPLPLGRQLIDLDNVAEALAIAEGEDYR
jgi:hypothetical protein